MTVTMDLVMRELRSIKQRIDVIAPAGRLLSAREVEKLYRLTRGQVEADWKSGNIPGSVRSSRGCKGVALFIDPKDAGRQYGVRYHA
jgi:hypothetical protein